MFGWAMGAKVFSILYKIFYEQCAMDIFVIDWERPKYYDKNFPAAPTIQMAGQ